MVSLFKGQSLGLRGMKLDVRAFDMLRKLQVSKNLYQRMHFEKSEFIRYIAQAPLHKLIALSTAIYCEEIQETSQKS